MWYIRSNICNCLYLLSTNEDYQYNGKKSRDKNPQLIYLHIELGQQQRRRGAWLVVIFYSDVKWEDNNIIIMTGCHTACHNALTGEQLTKDNTKYLNVSSLTCCYLNHSAPITRSQLKYIKAVKGFVMFLLAEKCYISCHIVIEVAIIVIGHRLYVM